MRKNVEDARRLAWAIPNGLTKPEGRRGKTVAIFIANLGTEKTQ